MKKVYLLLCDLDGTMRSEDRMFGACVTSKEEADKFVKECNIGYSRSYETTIVFDTMREAIEYYRTKLSVNGRT